MIAQLLEALLGMLRTKRHGPKIHSHQHLRDVQSQVEEHTSDAPVKKKNALQLELEITRIADQAIEPARPGPRGELWYPDACIKKGQRIKGTYPKKYPEGAIVHYTAGRREYKNRKPYETGEQAMDNSIAKHSYAYFTIGMDGTIWQSIPLDKWGYHAGKAYHPILNSSSVSKHCVGIEICNAGPLEEGKSWFKKEYPSDQIRTLAPYEYPNCKAGGQFLKYTAAQEQALTDLLLWLHWNNPDVFKLENVYGHDEVAPTRKTDPGGSLSMSMPAYRRYLLSKV